MKIALTAAGKTLDARLDSRFGRAPGFIIYDTDQQTFEVVNNDAGLHASQGAGIQSAETIARLGVQSLVTGHCGPNAFRVLCAAGVTVYTTTEQTVADALAAFRAGTLTVVSTADVEGHWA